jgi:hypothetical protein
MTHNWALFGVEVLCACLMFGAATTLEHRSSKYLPESFRLGGRQARWRM